MNAPIELPPPTRKTPVPFVTIVGATAGLLIPLLAVALLYWTTRSSRTPDALSAGQKLRELQAAEDRQLTTYDWIEKPAKDKSGVVRLPVSRARELVLQEMAGKQKESKR